MSRIVEGFKLYQKGNVFTLLYSEDDLQFRVISSKNKYLVSIVDNCIRCECDDWNYRYSQSKEEMSSFLCKHCYAALFKLAEVKGVNQQKQLFGQNPFVDQKEYEKQLNEISIREYNKSYCGEWKSGDGKDEPGD